MVRVESATATPEQLQRARVLFEQAMNEHGPGRQAFLDGGCNGDRDLRALVEEMIRASELENPILDGAVGLAGIVEGTALPHGTVIGRYRVVREIGSGGMGTVYLSEAVDGLADEFFAMKVVRWVSEEFLRRFKREQAILRRLEHPNVARFVEAGITDQRRPYFVMEYVQGEPIHAYCERKSLSTDARIRLFRQVCAAVQYLHQNSIVHRDLKPANVLVTADGVVKLVDFGIAKLLHAADGGASTANTAGLMTPDYASPEQITGDAATTLTDVYALGLLLYELLSGVRPFGLSRGHLSELLRKICEEDPPKPSVAMRSVRARQSQEPERSLNAELDNIVLKALEKEPARRYSSVERLDEDLWRYQSGLPILAQRDSLSYRTRKFLWRNKAGVAIAAVIIALIAAGIIATSFEARVARREALRAATHAREADRQRAIAESETRIAERELNRAERETAEAQRERQKAERRLSQLQQLANSAADIYTTARSSSASQEAELIARFAQHSLIALRTEKGLRPEQTQLLDQTTAEVQSYRLTSDRSWQVPRGWSAQETKPQQFRVGMDRTVRHGGKSSLFLHSLVPTPSGSVFVYQLFDASNYRGKRLRLTGFLRAEKVQGDALLGLALLGDGNRNVGYEGLTASGTSGWVKLSIVIDVPSACKLIHLFVQLSGRGTIWADDLKVETVPSSTPLTRRTAPTNLGFAKQ